MRNILLFSFLLCILGCSTVEEEKPQITQESLRGQLGQLANEANTVVKTFPIDSNNIPRSQEADGSLRTSTSYDWTSGFYSGTLWQLYRFSGNEELSKAAMAWTAFQEKEKLDTHTHDLGFKIYCSFGEAHKTKPTDHNKDVILHASNTLIRRYNPTVGAIRSWDFNKEVWQFPVIIDNMMNLEMLFEATKLSGDSTYHKIAHQHALTTMKNHFRADHSSYHVIDYDTLTGEIRNRHTHQGASHESSWARGQAWGLYGFTMSYRYTNEPQFLDKAKAIAQFFFEHPNFPEDGVPYWDFDAPNIPDTYRDASAAAIAISGLIELSKYDLDNAEKYLDWVDVTLNTLNSDEYKSALVPYILKHSVGSVPSDSEVDVPLTYADY
ncbi:MAG: glycoside hydrolase family 88 protein, partial [Bacteroidota bacterium]